MMAGRGLRDKECKDSIMQCERFKARKATKDAKLSGTSVKRFDDRSRDCSVFATGARLAVVIAVKELSGRPRCRRNRHLDGGRIAESKFEELVEFRQWPEVSLEFELPEPVRLMREWRWCRWVECFELAGRVGELLSVRVRLLEPSDPTLSMEDACGLVLDPKAVSATGDAGTERDPPGWMGWA